MAESGGMNHLLQCPWKATFIVHPKVQVTNQISSECQQLFNHKAAWKNKQRPESISNFQEVKGLIKMGSKFPKVECPFPEGPKWTAPNINLTLRNEHGCV